VAIQLFPYGMPPVGPNGEVLTVVGGRAAWAAAVGFANPMTTANDLIIGGPAGAPTRLPVGNPGTYLGYIAGVLGYFPAPGGLTAPSGAALGANLNLPAGASTVLFTIAGILAYRYVLSISAVVTPGAAGTGLLELSLAAGTATITAFLGAQAASAYMVGTGENVTLTLQLLLQVAAGGTVVATLHNASAVAASALAAGPISGLPATTWNLMRFA